MTPAQTAENPITVNNGFFTICTNDTQKSQTQNCQQSVALINGTGYEKMASGIPMARVMFASHAVGAIVLPVMLFHQIQLMVCAWLAQRYAARLDAAAAAAEPDPGDPGWNDV